MERKYKIVISNKVSRVLVFLLASTGFFSIDAVAQSQTKSKIKEREQIKNSINLHSPINSKELNKRELPLSNMLPDKLAVPERDPNYKSFSRGRSKDVKSKEQLKRRMLEVDYYSKGIDGYYRKFVEMGYVGEGWVETKELREAVGRVKSDIFRNLGGVQSSDPRFIKDMRRSSSSAVRVLGGVLDFLNKGSGKNIYLPDTPGYRGSNPIVRTVVTPGKYKYVEKWR